MTRSLPSTLPFLLMALMPPLAFACSSSGGGESSPSESCDGVDCSGNGNCSITGGDAVCVCDSGFHAEGLACVPNVQGDPCAGVDCGPGGSCSDGSGTASCTCGPGYTSIGPTSCVPLGGAGGASGAGGVGGAAGAGTGGSSTGGSGGSGGSGTGGTAGAGGAPPSTCTAGGLTGAQLLFHTTLDDRASVTTPATGDGTGVTFSTSPADDFVATPNGSGARFDEGGDALRYSQRVGSTINFSPTLGTIDFCFQPEWNHTDPGDRFLVRATTAGGGRIALRKASSDNQSALVVQASADGSSIYEFVINGSDYQMRAGGWYRLTVAWRFEPAGSEVQVYLNGTQLPASTTFGTAPVLPPADAAADLFIGSWDGTQDPAGGVFDEFHVYGAPAAPAAP